MSWIFVCAHKVGSDLSWTEEHWEPKSFQKVTSHLKSNAFDICFRSREHLEALNLLAEAAQPEQPSQPASHRSLLAHEAVPLWSS